MTVDVIVGNVFDKYATRNPLYRRVVAGYFCSLSKLVPEPMPRRVLEVGCGEGHIAGWLSRTAAPQSLVAVDLTTGLLAGAHARYPSVEFSCASASQLPFGDRSFDLVLFLEVLEHLPDPRRALAEARRVCSGQLVASVPREPVWRLLNLLRGAYWHRWGDTPGHVQHWSKESFLGLLQEHWAVKRFAMPLPWMMAQCSPE
jgi:2-polyprenyl-3-methyl-5-hydroxy-6-metoxy-1,4-benzoquinol methylase